MMGPVTVIDLGDTKSTAVIASGTPDGGIDVQCLVSIPSLGMKKGLIVDQSGVSKTISNLFGHLAKETGQEPSPSVVMTVSGAHLQGMTVQGFKPIIPANRAVTHQDVMEVVRHSRSGLVPPDRTQVQAIPREFRVDGLGAVANPVGRRGSKLEVVTYLVTGHNSHVNLVLSVLDSNEIKLDQFVYAPFASGIGVLNASELDLGAVVVDIGGQKTDVGVFNNGAFAFGCTIPAGGMNVSNDLVQLIQVDVDEAERLKIQHGAALAKDITEREAIDVRQMGQPMSRPMQRRVLCEIIESRMRELAKLVRAQVEKSGYMAGVKSSIVLTGGGARLAKTAELFSEIFPDHRIRTSEPDLGDKQQHVGIACAIGAAHFALQSSNEMQTIHENSGWQERVKGLWSMFNGKSQ